MKPDFPSEAAFAAAAAKLGCEVAAIKAVAIVEAGQEGAFFDDETPTKLFEPHVFSELTGHKYDGRRVPGVDKDWGVISRRRWMPGTYGPMSKQNIRLDAAAKLDRNAALQATSWGLFQILARNYKIAGFDSVQSFINAMYRSADDHLDAFVNVIIAMKLAPALRAKDWSAFARKYNGSGYRKNGYHTRMAWNYQDLTAAA